MEFGILIPGIPLTEKSQKECGLRIKTFFNHIFDLIEFEISTSLESSPSGEYSYREILLKVTVY